MMNEQALKEALKFFVLITSLTFGQEIVFLKGLPNMIYLSKGPITIIILLLATHIFS